MLIALECAFDCEQNSVINSVVSCSIVEIFIHEFHKNSGFNGLSLQKTTLLEICVKTALKISVNLCRCVIVCIKNSMFKNSIAIYCRRNFPDCLSVHIEHLSMMMRHVFETHQPSIPIEELLKAAATGDIHTVDEVISTRLYCG